MKPHEEILRSHLEGYPFMIQEVKQAETGWYALTDRGKKRIIYCPDENLLRWSHRWREYLADQGVRQVERYLTTKQREHWISVSVGCYALSDYWEQDTTWFTHPFLQKEGYQVLGETLARIHECFESIEEVYRGRYRKKGILNETRLKNSYRHLHAAMKEMEKETMNATNKWLLYNLFRVAERVKKAEALYRASGVENDQTPLSFAYFPLSSLVYWEEAWYITGLHNPVLVPRHEDTLSILEQIHETGGKEGVRVFLSAYAGRRSMPMRERNYLLALLSYPLPVFSRLENISVFVEEKERMGIDFQLQIRREHLLQCVLETQELCGEASG